MAGQVYLTDEQEKLVLTLLRNEALHAEEERGDEEKVEKCYELRDKIEV